MTGTAGGAVQVVGVLFGRPAGHPLARQPARRRVRPLVLSRRALETQSGHVRRNERHNEIVISRPLPRSARKARPPAAAAAAATATDVRAYARTETNLADPQRPAP